MHPVLRSVVRRAALDARRRRWCDCNSGKKGGALSVARRAQTRAQQVHGPPPPPPRRVLPPDFTTWWTCVTFGVLIAHIGLKFKPPPKTLEEMWSEAVSSEQAASAANIGSSCPCPCPPGATSPSSC
jgi:hypothetical protein